MNSFSLFFNVKLCKALVERYLLYTPGRTIHVQFHYSIPNILIFACNSTRSLLMETLFTYITLNITLSKCLIIGVFDVFFRVIQYIHSFIHICIHTDRIKIMTSLYPLKLNRKSPLLI